MTHSSPPAHDNDAADIIQSALSLNGDPQVLRNFYQKWAERYDTDVAEENYTAPRIIVDLLNNLPQSESAKAGLQILDAGCGTGLVGTLLHEAHYRQIDGFDLSTPMVEVAARTEVYRTLKGDVDLTQPMAQYGYTEGQYDAVLCCGVFTLGHVPPEAIQQLIWLTKQGGVILISTRVSYCETSNYEAYTYGLTENENGPISLLAKQLDLPYTIDGNAHYWAYERR